MNDLDLLKKMFERSGIVYDDTLFDLPIIIVQAKTGPNNHGNSGFTTWFNFDESGVLLSVCVDRGNT